MYLLIMLDLVNIKGLVINFHSVECKVQHSGG